MNCVYPKKVNLEHTNFVLAVDPGTYYTAFIIIYVIIYNLYHLQYFKKSIQMIKSKLA